MSVPSIVLDTNVLISAIVFGGRPREVLEKVISGTFAMAISAEMLDEFHRGFSREGSSATQAPLCAPS
jgi:predicted nucleic acid-binding protein